MSDDIKKYWIAADGNVKGPYPFDVLVIMWERSEIKITDQICQQGTETWIEVSSLVNALTKAAKAKSRIQTAPDSQSKNAKLVTGFIGLLVIGFGIWFWFGGGLEKRAQMNMSHIEQQVAENTVKEYDIARRSGSAMDAYVHAGFVAAAYLQAKDEANYQKWKGIESKEARRAGMPTQ